MNNLRFKDKNFFQDWKLQFGTVKIQNYLLERNKQKDATLETTKSRVNTKGDVTVSITLAQKT